MLLKMCSQLKGEVVVGDIRNGSRKRQAKGSKGERAKLWLQWNGFSSKHDAWALFLLQYIVKSRKLSKVTKYFKSTKSRGKA